MYVMVDIGGTKTRIARSRDLETFEEPVLSDTPKVAEALVDYIGSAIEKLSQGETIEGVSVGKPIYMPATLESSLRARIAGPVHFGNDTALVGLGEAHFGAGKGARLFVYVTISTGVNGVRIVDGRIGPSAYGFEIGGQYLSAEGTTSWEEMISGTAIEKRFGMHPKELGLEHPVWEELAKTTAYGLHNTILHWSPERVAIGGSMVNHIGIPVDRVQAHLKEIMRKFPGIPEIVHSELGDLGGLWGGMALLREHRGGSL